MKKTFIHIDPLVDAWNTTGTLFQTSVGMDCASCGMEITGEDSCGSCNQCKECCICDI